MTTILASRPEIPGEDFSRVAMTEQTMQLLQKLRGMHGDLMFHLSGGCCDGSSPMCYPVGDFRTGGSDLLLGTFELPATDDLPATELGFWVAKPHFEYLRGSHITLDTVDGRGAGFSVESPEGKRFVMRSTLLPS
ncbi:MAG TPA: DUF779 domain-containing protein [Enteractinococcus helveticum]|uniref:DUF779 domain-containing protein n=1 Tax=Enteractinococcus helveticum TaxID=1837282 RepID=A0A921FPK1_9MICC|nr:DUF779 domain-containing protein [Enteractinococcus helveticum]HJF15117.1 DUF779 domain-containing protein [Enteractinococcus helveticum]